MHCVSPPAKINLHLRVGPVRGDGFHPLLTWMTTVGFFDRLTITPGTGGIAFTCDDPALPTDGRNLVVRAANLLAAGRSASIHLEKNIPSGGGLGGGSSDAASALVALNEFWNLGHPPDHLAELAATLGSDVPFFLYGPSSVCRGRGEIIRPIPVPAVARWAVLVLPGIALPTPVVYRKFDELKLGADVDTEPDWSALTKLPAVELLQHLVNDLEPPAFALRPELDRLRRKIETDLGRIVRMSGSGSTLFTLYDDHVAAAGAAEKIKSTGVRAVAVKMTPTPANDFPPLPVPRGRGPERRYGVA